MSQPDPHASFRAVASLGRDPVAIVDAQLKVRWLNPAAFHFIGLDPSPDPGEPPDIGSASRIPLIHLMTAGAPRISGWRAILGLLLGDPGRRHPVLLQYDDGRALEFTVTAHGGPEGSWYVAAVPNVQATVPDETYRSLIEHIPGTFYRCRMDAVGTILYISPAVEDLCGVPAARFVSGEVTWRDVVHPDDFSHLSAVMRAAVDARRPFDLEYRVLHVDGATRWVSQTGTGVFGADGSFRHSAGFLRDNTEERATRERLREAERMATEALHKAQTALAELSAYRAALDDHALVLVTEVDGTVVHANERLARQFGYRVDELVGASGYLLDSGEQNRRNLEALVASIEKGETWRGETVVVARDGERFRLDATVIPVHFAGRTRQPGHVITIFEDLAARRESHRRALEERQQLELALDGGDLGLWDWDVPSGRVTFDARWASMLGERADDLPPRYEAWSSRVHPEDLARALELLDRTFRGETPRYEWTGRMRHRDGSWRWILARGRVVSRDKEGAPLRMVGTHADVSANVAAEQALTAQLAKLEAAERQTRMGHWSWDVATELVTWSDNLMAILGRRSGDGRLTYAEMMSHFDVASQQAIAQAVQRSLLYGEPYRIRLRTSATKAQWLDTHAQVRRGEDGSVAGIVGTCIDITESVEREEALQAAMQRIEAATRAKTEFLANMSHEIRTPLTAILGYAEILRDVFAARPDAGEPLGAIDSIMVAGRHLLTVLNDILDISRIEAGRLPLENAPLALRDLFRDVLTLMLPRAREKALALSVVADSPLPATVHGDPKRLRQILMNLVGNAVKFTASGAITVTVRTEPPEDPRWLVIDVADSGIGMSAVSVTALFQPFSQVDSSASRRHDGAGLGLSICRRLVDMMGGTVRVLWTEVGRGSCFRVEVPLHVVPGSVTLEGVDCLALADGQGAAPVPAPVRTPISGRILLVEDGELNQALFRYHLERAGAVVTVADDGHMALARIHEVHGTAQAFDLIVTDIQMPGLDGYELTRSLRALGCRTPILALTAHAMAEDRQRCFDAGCDDYLVKPIEREALVNRCRAWIGHRSQHVPKTPAAAVTA
jgi:PAS domain S-box-containing protein